MNRGPILQPGSLHFLSPHCAFVQVKMCIAHYCAISQFLHIVLTILCNSEVASASPEGRISCIPPFLYLIQKQQKGLISLKSASLLLLFVMVA